MDLHIIYIQVYSNFLWFYIYHQINKGFDNNNLCKSSMAGASASIVSDTVTHPFKVFKLLKQTNTDFIFNFKTAYRGYFIRILLMGFKVLLMVFYGIYLIISSINNINDLKLIIYNINDLKLIIYNINIYILIYF